MKLSILIPTVRGRETLLASLLAELEDQKSRMINPGHVEILVCHDNYERKVGAKRNELLSQASGDYVAFVDDDDFVSPEYIRLILEGIYKGVDCCSLRGIFTENGLNPEIFEHSIKYHEYKTNNTDKDIRYERFPNHLNAIKATTAKRFQFPDKSISEDTEWATQIFKSGLLKTEHYIPHVIYFYRHNQNDSVQNRKR